MIETRANELFETIKRTRMAQNNGGRECRDTHEAQLNLLRLPQRVVARC